jgi:hypothetical protein
LFLEEDDVNLLLVYDKFIEEEDNYQHSHYGFIHRVRSNKVIERNLIIMAGCWLVGCFCYYLMTFYVKYIPGNIFQNVTFSASADIIGFIATGITF